MRPPQRVAIRPRWSTMSDLANHVIYIRCETSDEVIYKTACRQWLTIHTPRHDVEGCPECLRSAHSLPTCTDEPASGPTDQQ